MGCHKSKLQHTGSEEAYVQGGHINLWDHGQEPHPGNSQLSSNNGFQSDHIFDYNVPGNTFVADTRHQTCYSYFNANVTGSFGAAAPSYTSDSELNIVPYFNGNDYYDGSVRDLGIHKINNFTYNSYGQEQKQHSYISHSYPSQSMVNREQICGTFNQEQIMGPPLRPVSRPRLARRSSFNDGYRRTHRNTHFNPMVRHGSLDNISFRSRNRYLKKNFASDHNLYRYSSVCPRWGNSEGRGRKRGMKRKSWDNDSLNSNSTFSDETESVIKTNSDTDQVEPRVKRRPSDIVDDSNSSISVLNKMKTEARDSCKTKTKAINKSVELLSCYDEPFDILDLLIFPDEWSSCALAKTGLVDVSLASPEGKSVLKYFSRSSQSREFKLCIRGIVRVENPFMHSCYLLKKQEMESRNVRVDELYLYHGTKKDHLDGILEDNLNWRLYSEKHRFGQGVSFSPLATYSSHYSDKTPEKIMLLFKVLASNSIGGSPNLKVPPIIKDIVYDVSIKDDTTVIVKYYDNEFYPLYKITYSKIMRD